MPEKPGADIPPWLIPLACTRIETTQNGELVGMEQIAACIKSQSAFSNQLSVSLGDTAYNNPLCMRIAKRNENQVHINRTRNNRKFFYPYDPNENEGAKKRGRPKSYIEHFFRFGKNRLLMDKIQTPDVRHEESWWQLVMIAYAQLYLSRSIANALPNPWEKYLPTFR